MKKFASLLIILAGAVWGTMGIFVNEMDKIGFSSLQTSSVRVTVAAVAMLVLLAVTDKSKLKIHIRDLYLFIILGVGCILGMSILYFYTIQHTSLSIAAILLYTSPVWVIIISAIFLHEKITWQKLLAVILAFLGCAMVSGLGGADAISPFFLLTGVGSGLAYGLYSIFGTVAMRKYHPYTVTAYSFVFAAIASWFIANAFKIIDVASKHFFDSEFDITTILNQSGYAEDYIRSEFKKQTGYSPIDFLAKLRIDHAKKLIEIFRNKLTVAEIGESCGFTDSAYFSRRFKQFVGVSPVRYKTNISKTTEQFPVL